MIELGELAGPTPLIDAIRLGVVELVAQGEPQSAINTADDWKTWNNMKIGK